MLVLGVHLRLGSLLITGFKKKADVLAIVQMGIDFCLTN